MKHRRIFILLILLPAMALANEPSGKDTSRYPIRRIGFRENFVSDTTAVDSANTNLHVFNPCFIDDRSFTFLSRTGYPLQSNVLCSRLNNDDNFFPALSYMPMIIDNRKAFFYDTRKPYTSFTYKNLGQIRSKDEYLQIIHTQNLTRASNLGLYYNLYANASRDDYQKSSSHALSLFYRYSGKHYFSYYQFYYNSYSQHENGGIKADSMINYAKDDFFGIDVQFKEATSRFARKGFSMLQEFRLRGLASVDSSIVIRDLGSVYYAFHYQDNRRNYTEGADDNTLYYKNNYSKSGYSSDSIGLQAIHNKILLSSPQLYKYFPNLRLSLSNAIYFADFGMPSDTFYVDNTRYARLNHAQRFSQTYTSIDVTQKIGWINWDFGWDFYVLGYGIGDSKLKALGNVNIGKNKAIALQLRAENTLETPSFMYTRYYSNHFLWNRTNVFRRQIKQSFAAQASMFHGLLGVGADYILQTGYMYFDIQKGQAIQADSSLHVLAMNASGNFRLWKFLFYSKAVYQVHNDVPYINVPRVIYYGSFNFENTFHFFTGGRLYTRLGSDVTYTTAFNRDTYNPALGVFAPQNDVTGIEYLRLDAHITLKVKSVSFFIKYSHLNATQTSLRQFDALHYPMLPASVSYGINWLFYD